MAKNKYENDFPQRAEEFLNKGHTEKELAAHLGISKSSLELYKTKYTDFSDSLKRGKISTDKEVENSLLKRALGYTYQEIHKERITDTGQKARHKKTAITLTEQEWENAIDYFEGACAYCGSTKEITKDHIIPLNKGGEMSASNIVPCCRECNSSKIDKNMINWFKVQPFYDSDRLADINQYVEEATNRIINDELVITKVIEKHVVPDVTAQIFWLKNRLPKDWRDKKEIDVPEGLTIKYELSGPNENGNKKDNI